jgi:hypothetical protein
MNDKEESKHEQDETLASIPEVEHLCVNSHKYPLTSIYVDGPQKLEVPHNCSQIISSQRLDYPDCDAEYANVI